MAFTCHGGGPHFVLQYKDTQLVESVANCLIKIVERVCRSSDMLDELSKHGLVQQATQLIELKGRTTVCQSIYVGFIGLLVKLAAGSVMAVRTLFELKHQQHIKGHFIHFRPLKRCAFNSNG